IPSMEVLSYGRLAAAVGIWSGTPTAFPSLGSALPRSLVRSRVTTGGGDRQTSDVVVPTGAVVLHGLLGQAALHQPQTRLVPLGMQGDLDPGRPGADGVTRLVPTEGEHHLLVGDDLHELAGGLIATRDEHPVDAAGTRVELGLGPLPLHVLLGDGEVLEDRRRAGVDHHLPH